MKKILNSLIILTAFAASFASCTKEINNQEDELVIGKTKTVTVKTDIATRTTLDANHQNIVWSEGDKISIFNDVDDTNLEKAYTAGGDLIVTVPATTKEIYAHYPYYKNNTSGPDEVSVYINKDQKQTNPGELNGYNYPMVAKGTVKEETNGDETVYKAIVSLYPVASALALNIYHSELSGEEAETVSSVKVTPSSANTLFTGSQTTDLTKDNIKYTSAASSDPITVTLTNPLTLGNSKPADKQKFDGQIYVCLAKQSYANVTFEIETNKGKYTITSSDTPFDCVNNDFIPVNINLKNATFVPDLPPTDFEWNLVTSASQIVPGEQVVIAAKNAAFAMSQTQNSNNRGQVAIAKTGSKILWEEDAEVQVFDVVAGTVDNTVSFQCAGGAKDKQYIYAASSGSNYLRSQASNNANSSWTVTIDATSYAAELKAQGDNTRNLLRYNSGSSCFSCYSSGQDDIVLYIKGEAADPNAKAIIANGTLEVAATGAAADYEGAYSLQNIDENTETISLTASENIIDPLALGGDVTFSMAPNYGSSKVNGSITLTLASDANVSATIPVEQKGSTLKTSVTEEVVIPADATEVTFTVTSPEFGWSIKADNSNVQFTQSGAATETPSTVTVTSSVEAGDEVELIATLTVYRNNNEDDPQAKTINVRKAAAGGDIALYTATFEEDAAHRTSGNNSYTSLNTYTVSGVEWDLMYADAVTSGSPLDGSANVMARVAKNTTNSPYAVTKNLISGEHTITKVTFLSNLGSDVTLTVQYSTDGNTWNTVTASKDTDVHTSNGYSAIIPDVTTSVFRLKYTWSVASSTNGTRDSKLDNVIVYGH